MKYIFLQVIPRQLCDNAGFDATDVLNKLRQKHASGRLHLTLFQYLSVTTISELLHELRIYYFSNFCNPLLSGEGANYGVDINTGGMAESFSNFVWEPAVVKVYVFGL